MTDSWSEVEGETEPRFKKNDVESLMTCLNIPEEIVCQQGTVCSGLQGLFILFKNTGLPCRFLDMAYRFGRSPPELRLIFKQVLDLVYEAYYHRLQSCD